MTASIRVLQDPHLDGPTNMARDEALLTLVGTGESPPTLRLYQWDPPTISLGYFQRFADYLALDSPANRLAVVRRLTGGGAILHDWELTYSLTFPTGHDLLVGGPNRLYEWVHDAIRVALETLHIRADRGGPTDDSGAARGPFFCFDRRHRYDLLTGGAKIAGSAQRRTRNAVLQHGSIILGSRFHQQSTAAVALPAEAAIAQLRSTLPAALLTPYEIRWNAGTWTRREEQAAQSLVSKYAGPEWTQRT